MTDIPDLEPIRGSLRACLSARDDVVAAYLFGSVARGTATRRSDVDVAVLFVEPLDRTFPGPALLLEGELEGSLRRPVQVVTLNRAPVDLVHRVLRDGILVIDANRSARIRFEVQRRNAYFDLLPFLRRYRRTERAVA